MCCQPQRSGLLRSLPCRGHRHAGYNFPSLFRNTLDSHRYLDLKDWPAISTSMSLRPPFSEGGTRWIAKGQRQRRPYASFYCVLLRPSRTRFAQLKSRHCASQRDLNYLSAPDRHHQRHRHGAYRSRFGVIGHARVEFLSG